MYSLLGWLNAIITIFLLLPFAMNFFIKKKEGTWYNISKAIRKAHKPLGAALVIIALVHGYLALGALSLHTGTIVGILVVLTGLAGALFGVMKKKGLFKLHKAIAYVFVIVLILHLLVPSILG